MMSQHPTSLHHTSRLLVDKDHQRVPNTLYKRAILKAIEGLNDYHSRSNVDLIRRHTKDLLEDQQPWNDALFLQTLKSISKNGEITQTSHVLAELSPSYKKKRADSLSQQLLLEERLRTNGQQATGTIPPLLPLSPGAATYYNPFTHNMASSSAPVSIHQQQQHHHHNNHHFSTHDGSPPKEAPHRKPEHEKWKITPKKIYDKTTIINPMDTH